MAASSGTARPETTAAAAAVRYATTPTSPGAINPRAIPLGDGYVSTTARVGHVDSCVTSFGSGRGALVNGPWIDTAHHTWSETAKRAVSGHVSWRGTFVQRVAGGKRMLTFNDLPTDHTTGVFPIATTDPAHAYDANPNHIAAQSFDWRLAASPAAARHASCLGGGPIGVLSDGVVLFDALDGQGRDAAAHEVLDRCAAHPDQSSTYHHHDVPPCILDSVRDGQTKLVGYALDGYGVYVVKRRDGSLPTNIELDGCHGTTSNVIWNGKLRRIYHYVATLEYPYTLGCYHGSPAG